ncbi:ribosome small subunit-dependent GTPase A [candidate division KSB1 bacterium]|nr:ribosome small subunit-dependent GTPase A [candidate division KSB1 bacterium]
MCATENISLYSLGWNSHFQNQFESLQSDGLIPGRIFREEKSQYGILTGESEFIAKPSGKLRHLLNSVNERLVVGDWVALNPGSDQSSATVEFLLQRKSSVSRKAASGRKRKSGGQMLEQVIAANMDVIFIVTGLDHDYNVRRIERYLTLVWNSGATPVVVLNKTDLCNDLDERLEEVEEVAIGAPVLAITAKEKKDVIRLQPYFADGKTAALLGSSGAGKSTIINTLLGFEKQKVKEISESVHKGQHTTTHRELILMPEGGILMDNPGMREIQLWGDADDVDSAFHDIELLANDCKFKDCAHESEPGCAVKNAVDSGELDDERLGSFHKMKRELEFLEQRQHKTADAIEKEKWRVIMKNAPKSNKT